MTILSILKRCSTVGTLGFRNMSGGPRTFEMRPNKWNWEKFKDMLHFYVILGVIPLTAFTTYVNIFVGPATLTKIPEGYVPTEDEYYKHPITRWCMRNIYMGYQEEYEKGLHLIYYQDEKRVMQNIETKVKMVIKDRGDSQVYYYKAPALNHFKEVREDHENDRYAFGRN